MGGTRTLSLFCVLAVTAPAGAEARSAKAQGARAVSLLPEQVQWTGHDRAAVDRAKVVNLAVDGGSAGWGLDFLSLGSSRTGDADCWAPDRRFNERQVGMQAWQALGNDDVIRFGAHVGAATRRSLSPISFPAKSMAGYVDAQLTWEHSARLVVSTGWYQQGGWGGRRMDLDVVRMGNGEPAMASGMRATVRLAAGSDRSETHSWLTLEARKGSRAVGAGGAMRNASDIGLTLTSMF